MNADFLARGKTFCAKLRALSDEADGWVSDVVDVWPGRRDEAMGLHGKLQRWLQEARTDASSLTVVLAQDVAP